MKLLKSGGILLFSFLALVAHANQSEAVRACALLKTSYYSKSEKEDISFYCALPEKTQNILPSVYWLRAREYQKTFLLKQPTTPQASRNLPQGQRGDRHVSQILNNPQSCQFYSSISPSVQSKRVAQGPRLMIVQDAEDLLKKCENFKTLINDGKISRCSVIELAGHSTESVGLDTVIGVDYALGEKRIHPEPWLMGEISRCFKQILIENGGIVASTCGGEKADDGKYHYWKSKSLAQQELSNLLEIPIISGIGPVRFASQYGPNGAEAVSGWTLTYPMKP